MQKFRGLAGKRGSGWYSRSAHTGNVNNAIVTVLLGIREEGSDSSVKRLLEKWDFRLLECTDGMEAVRKSFTNKPDLIILEVNLPRLNGYQCARIIKSDPFMSTIPIVHIGNSKSPIEQYWSRVCGGEDYLQEPVSEKALEKMLSEVHRKEGSKRRLLTPISVIPDLDDNAILSLAGSLLEQDLLRSTILNEINMIDASSLQTEEVVMSVMTILGSLYDFTLGAALLIRGHHGEFFFCRSEEVDPVRLEEIKELVFKHLQQNGVYLLPQEVKERHLHQACPERASDNIDDIYIYTKEKSPIRSVLAFENIGFERLKEIDQEILTHALEISSNVVEKRLFFQMSQELSILDAVTDGNSMGPFLAILRREIENAARNEYPVSLYTLSFSNFSEMTRDLSPPRMHGLVHRIQNLILKAMRKSDIVARWETTSFAVLLTHTPLEKARLAQERIVEYLRKNLSEHLPSSPRMVIDTGITQFDSAQDHTPEIFFSRARPERNPNKVHRERPSHGSSLVAFNE